MNKIVRKENQVSKSNDPGKKPSSQLGTEEYALVAAQEAFIVRSQILIYDLLSDRGMTHADLATRLGVSEARVSQMFGDAAKNLTMRTIAKIMHVLGETAVLTTRSAENAALANSRTAEIAAAEMPVEFWQEMKVVPLRPGARKAGTRGLRLPDDLSTIRFGADNDDYADFETAA